MADDVARGLIGLLRMLGVAGATWQLLLWVGGISLAGTIFVYSGKTPWERADRLWGLISIPLIGLAAFVAWVALRWLVNVGNGIVS
ncbi:MAG TPA: hypothetical protein DHW63_00805 [Hyphomonadaceae bacterium]|nr:hypothetical protein [Hyphomonadaceae bacterium]